MDDGIMEYVALAVMIAINVAGWVFTSARNKEAIKSATEAAKDAAKTELTRMEETVRSLPCVRDHDYEKDNGRLLEQVDQLERKMDMVLLQLTKK
jgi:Tfp pilus assembly protein PilO